LLPALRFGSNFFFHIGVRGAIGGVPAAPRLLFNTRLKKCKSQNKNKRKYNPVNKKQRANIMPKIKTKIAAYASLQ